MALFGHRGERRELNGDYLQEQCGSAPATKLDVMDEQAGDPFARSEPGQIRPRIEPDDKIDSLVVLFVNEEINTGSEGTSESRWC